MSSRENQREGGRAGCARDGAQQCGSEEVWAWVTCTLQTWGASSMAQWVWGLQSQRRSCCRAEGTTLAAPEFAFALYLVCTGPKLMGWCCHWEGGFCLPQPMLTHRPKAPVLTLGEVHCCLSFIHSVASYQPWQSSVRWRMALVCCVYLTFQISPYIYLICVSLLLRTTQPGIMSCTCKPSTWE